MVQYTYIQYNDINPKISELAASRVEAVRKTFIIGVKACVCVFFF